MTHQTSHGERRVCSLLRHSTCISFSLTSILQHLGSHSIVSMRKYGLIEVKRLVQDPQTTDGQLRFQLRSPLALCLFLPQFVHLRLGTAESPPNNRDSSFLPNALSSACLSPSCPPFLVLLTLIQIRGPQRRSPLMILSSPRLSPAYS